MGLPYGGRLRRGRARHRRFEIAVSKETKIVWLATPIAHVRLAPGRYIIHSPDKKTPMGITKSGSIAIPAIDHLKWHMYGASLTVRLQPGGTPVITGRHRPSGR